MRKAVPFLVAALILVEGACSRSANFYVDKGDKLYAKGAVADAELNYKKATQRDPAYGQAWYQLGFLYLRTARTAEAYSTLSRAVDLMPNREDVKITLADLCMAVYIADRRRPALMYKRVETLADQLLAKDAKSYAGLRLKGHLAAADRKFADAEELYRRANEINPMQPEVVLAWTQVLFLDSRGEQGEQLASQFLEKTKTYFPIYDLMYQHYIQSNRIDEAEKILIARKDNNPKDPGARLELAAFYNARSREDEMKAVLQGLLNDPQTFPKAHLQVGDLFFKVQRWDDALAQYTLGTQGNPKDKIVYLKRIADLWLAQGKGEQADHVVDEILAVQPGDPSALGVRASLLLAKPSPENIAKAATMFQELVDKDPDNAVMRFNLGRALADKGDGDKAKAQLQEAIRLRREFVPPRMILAELSHAKHDYQNTLQYTKEILELNPGQSRARLLHAISLLNTGNAAGGRVELRDLEKENPADTDVQLELGAVDLNENRLPEAEQRFRKLATASKGDLRPLTGLVRTLLVERPDAALSLLQEEVRKSPKSVELRAMLAATETQVGKYDLAVAEYQRLAADAPASPQVQLALGNVYRRLGDLGNAVTAYQKAQSLAPNDAAPLALLGESLSLTGQKAQALENYRRALQMKPDSAPLMNATAYLIAETGGSLDEALKLAQKAVASNAKQLNYSDTLGWIYFKKDLNESAVRVFFNLTIQDSDNATFHYHYGMALLKKGDKKMAESELKTALSKKPTDDVRRDIETALQKIG